MYTATSKGKRRPFLWLITNATEIQQMLGDELACKKQSNRKKK